MNNELRQVILDYLSGIKEYPQVVGVVLTGSAGREDMDQYSDIDNVIFVKGPTTIKEGKFMLGKYLFDSRIVNIEEIQSNWSEDKFFVYLNSSIVYDPSNIISKIIFSKKEEWATKMLKRLQLALVELSVIYEFSDNWKGLKTVTHYHKFLDRNDYISAHRILNIGFEIILDILYLINDSPIPDIKNKIRLLPKVRILPDNTNKLVNEVVLITSFDVNDLNRRYKALTLFVDFIKDNIEKSQLHISDNIYQYYLANRA